MNDFASLRNANFSGDMDDSNILMDDEKVREKGWFYTIYDQLMKSIDLTLLSSLDETLAKERIREAAIELMESQSIPLSSVARSRIIDDIEDEILGLGPLEELMRDSSIADILVNRFDSIFIEKHGKLERK